MSDRSHCSCLYSQVLATFRNVAIYFIYLIKDLASIGLITVFLA